MNEAENQMNEEVFNTLKPPAFYVRQKLKGQHHKTLELICIFHL